MLLSFICFFIDTKTNSWTLQLSRLYSTIFLWFLLSEGCLFGSIFWSLFLGHFCSNELHSFQLFPLEHAVQFSMAKNCVQIFYLDLGNILLNTFILFLSGLTANNVLFSLALRCSQLRTTYLLCTLLLSSGFLANQYFEFGAFQPAFNTNFFCSSFMVLESVHFSHVLIGFFGWIVGTNGNWRQGEGSALEEKALALSLRFRNCHGWNGDDGDWLLFGVLASFWSASLAAVFASTPSNFTSLDANCSIFSDLSLDLSSWQPS